MNWKLQGRRLLVGAGVTFGALLLILALVAVRLIIYLVGGSYDMTFWPSLLIFFWVAGRVFEELKKPS